MKRIIFYLFLICLFLNSCITPKVHNKLISDYNKIKQMTFNLPKINVKPDCSYKLKYDGIFNI